MFGSRNNMQKVTAHINEIYFEKKKIPRNKCTILW